MKPVSVLLLGAALLSLGGCQSLREAAGLTKLPPDEFAVSTKAALVVPPDYNLRPPQPGAAPITQTDPSVQAQSALFGSTDPQTIAASMTGNYTPAEKMLLASAGAQNADPSIRAQLMSDDARNLQGADRSFTDRLLGPPPPEPKPVPAQNNAKTDSDSGGWFDWF